MLPSNTTTATVSLSDMMRATRHILVVEQNPCIAELLERALQLPGYTTTRLSCGYAHLLTLPLALPWLRYASAILLDFNNSTLSPGDVTTFVTRLRARWSDQGPMPACIVLTTNPRVHDHVEASGYRALLPFYLRDLQRVLEEELGTSPLDAVVENPLSL